MKEIIDDYISLCSVSGLTNIKNRTLLAFSVPESINENLLYNIYYDPATRSHNSPFKYIGLYVNKSIVAVGEINKIIYCNLENEKLVPTNGNNLDELTVEEYNRIKETIENTPYYNLRIGSKFFLVDKFYKTNYKASPFRTKKYLWLNKIDGFREGMNAKEIAELLNGKSWDI